MKTLKITLAVVVVVAICAGTYFWIQNLKEPEKARAEVNNSGTTVLSEIDKIKTMPDSKFCKDLYLQVAYKINALYKPSPPKYPYGRFGYTQSDNDQWKENLEKRLYAVYANKFFKQAKTVFTGEVWNPEDLRFIQNEKNEMKKSKFLLKGSPIDNDLTTIQKVLDKYNEITMFIFNCKNFEYSNTVWQSSFPISVVQYKISRSKSYLDNGLENGFVKNCVLLHNELKSVPQILSSEHVSYLDKKINAWTGQYSKYTSYKDYTNYLFKPLNTELELLDDTIYESTNYINEYNRLLDKLNADNSKAYIYKY